MKVYSAGCDSSLGSALYPYGYDGNVGTTMAFALEYSRHTEVKTANIESFYTSTLGGLEGLIEWIVNTFWDGGTLRDIFDPYNNFVGQISGSFGINLNEPIYNWDDEWIYDLISFGHGLPRIKAYERSDQNYFVYNVNDSYNVSLEIDSSDPFIFQIGTDVAVNYAAGTQIINHTVSGGAYYYQLKTLQGSGESNVKIKVCYNTSAYDYAYNRLVHEEVGNITYAQNDLKDKYQVVRILELDGDGNVCLYPLGENGYVDRTVALSHLPPVNQIEDIETYKADTTHKRTDICFNQSYYKQEGSGESNYDSEASGTTILDSSTLYKTWINDDFYTAEYASLVLRVRSPSIVEIRFRTTVTYGKVEMWIGQEKTAPTENVTGSEDGWSYIERRYEIELGIGDIVISFKIWTTLQDTQPFRIEIRGEDGNKWTGGDVGHYLMENADADNPNFEVIGLEDYGAFKGIPNWITTGEYYHKNDMDELQLAQMPEDAQDSYKSAIAQPDPVDNRVLDINEIFEQFYAKYADMKGDVKTQIYATLTFEIDMGFWSFTCDEIAELVWNILNSLVFGCIDALISKLDTEEKANLAHLERKFKGSLQFLDKDNPLKWFNMNKELLINFYNSESASGKLSGLFRRIASGIV